MKWIIGICGFALALYAGFQSILISQAGISQQIPQLMGDGGGGVLFATLTLLASVICVIKPFFSAFAFLLCTLQSAFVSFLFNDPSILLWSLGTAILAGLCFFAATRNKNRSKNKKGKIKYTKKPTGM